MRTRLVLIASAYLTLVSVSASAVFVVPNNGTVSVELDLTPPLKSSATGYLVLKPTGTTQIFETEKENPPPGYNPAASPTISVGSVSGERANVEALVPEGQYEAVILIKSSDGKCTPIDEKDPAQKGRYIGCIPTPGDRQCSLGSLTIKADQKTTAKAHCIELN